MVDVLPISTQLDTHLLWRILDVTRQLGMPTDLDTMLECVIDAARDVLQADRGTVFLYDEKTDELWAKVGTGLNQIRFPATRGIAGECAQSRRVINVPDCYADTRFNPDVDRKTGYRTRCLLTVPLVGIDEKLVGVMQVLNKRTGVFDEDDERISTALAAQCAVALQRATLLEAHVIKQKLEHDLELARDIQQNVLPRSMPELSGYDLTGWSRPADRTGGDIYDAISLDEHRTLLLMGDATGHGIGPALSVTQMRAMIRMAVRCGSDLDSMFVHVNDQLVEDLADNRFITAFLGILDMRTHELHYHAGGQGPLLHLHAATGQCDQLDASTLPMGIMSGIPLTSPAPIRMEPGDLFALISDGIFEAMNASDDQYEAERTIALLAKHAGESTEIIRQRLIEDVATFAGTTPQGDDMTIVLVKRDVR